MDFLKCKWEGTGYKIAKNDNIHQQEGLGYRVPQKHMVKDCHMPI